MSQFVHRLLHPIICGAKRPNGKHFFLYFQSIPIPTGFLDAIIQALPNWRKMSASLPIVTWPSFIDYVRSKVNMLASEDHLKEVMCQLQLVGEVMFKLYIGF